MLSSWRSLYEVNFELHLELWVGMRYGVGMGGVSEVKEASKPRDTGKSHAVGKCN